MRFTHKTKIQHFKLGLHEQLRTNFVTPLTVTKQSVSSGFITDPKWKHPDLQQKQAVDYAADYLTEIRQHIMNEFLPSLYGEVFLRHQPISYVITVPAIWSDKAKYLTGQAASRAGISNERLVLITEPEAAALYCVTVCEEGDLLVGDQFLICDAGGGTVVRPLIFLSHLFRT